MIELRIKLKPSNPKGQASRLSLDGCHFWFFSKLVGDRWMVNYIFIFPEQLVTVIESTKVYTALGQAPQVPAFPRIGRVLRISLVGEACQRFAAGGMWDFE